jgi:hypothetical protein
VAGPAHAGAGIQELSVKGGATVSEGFYKIEFAGPVGNGSGGIVLKDGRLVGTDGGVDYAGTLRAMFHEKRLDMIAADQMPFALPFNENGLLVVHVMPLDALLSGAHNATVPDLLENPDLLKPPVSGSDRAHAARPTFEGVLTRYTNGTTNVGYVQAWRNGIIEGVAIRVAISDHRDGQGQFRPMADSRDLEKRIVRAVLTYSKKLETAGFHPPLAIFTAMLNAQGVILRSDDLGHDPTPFGRDRMSFVPAVANEFLKDPEACAQVLCRAFDQIANAGGLDASPTFAEDGTWTPAAEMEGIGR